MTGGYGSATDRAPADDEGALRDALAAEDASTRRDAALALASHADGGLDAATVDALAARVREDPDADVRQFAVEALGEADAGAAAIHDALADVDEWVRAEAVVAHSRVAPEAPGPLHERLDDDDSGWVRRNAVVALGKTRAASQSTLVECIKTDPHPPVREYAAQFLPDVLEDEATGERILAAVLAREPNAFVRAKAAEGLGVLGTDRATTALEEFGVEDPSDDVSRTARRALADARGVDPDDLDVDAPDADRPGRTPPAPGGGPDRPGERSGHPRGEPTGRGAPGGAPGFDPPNHLDAELDDRR